MKALIVIALLLSTTATAQNVDSSFHWALKRLATDTVALFKNSKISITDRNGVDIDAWGGDNVWSVCNYKKVDSGYQCIFHSENELYIFQDRKRIKTYYSKTTIYLK